MIASVMSNGRGHELTISSVTYGELMVGMLKNDNPRRRTALREVLAPTRVVAFDKSAAVEFARVTAELEQSGQVIGPDDRQIAGHAISLGCRFVTRNGEKFSRLSRLEREDWAR